MTVLKQFIKKIGEELAVSADRVLIKYTGKVINKNQTVGYLGICKETILKAEVRGKCVLKEKLLHPMYTFVLSSFS